MVEALNMNHSELDYYSLRYTTLIQCLNCDIYTKYGTLNIDSSTIDVGDAAYSAVETRE